MASAGATLRTSPEEKKKADKDGRYIAGLIRGNYEFGDVITVDTANGARHFGFYAGTILEPVPVVLVAGTYNNYLGEWNKKWFDHLFAIETRLIVNFKALAMKQ